MGNTPREKALYMTGMTFGVAVGCFALALASLRAQDYLVLFTALTLGATMSVVALIWRNRVKNLP